MGKPVVRTGDKIVALPPNLPIPAVFMGPVIGNLNGSGGFTACGEPVCLPKDVEDLEVPATYTVGPYTQTPGSGKVKFKLAGGHTTKKTKTKGEFIVVNDGTPLDFEFNVDVGAAGPPGTQPPTDQNKKYFGKANFQCIPMPKPVTAG
ncbi:hypothetical protein [Streptomyces murinus]|uniref:hypothetical protein n=1 Tax=Streptomyces murinus TaxID=33900 RepID=UPI0037FE939F